MFSAAEARAEEIARWWEAIPDDRTRELYDRLAEQICEQGYTFERYCASLRSMLHSYAAEGVELDGQYIPQCTREDYEDIARSAGCDPVTLQAGANMARWLAISIVIVTGVVIWRNFT